MNFPANPPEYGNARVIPVQVSDLVMARTLAGRAERTTLKARNP